VSGAGLLVALLLSSTGWESVPEARREAEVTQLRTQPLADRVVALSQAFIGTPYVLSPLGEGVGKDPDPLIRYDAVDCVTLVEEVMAMSLAPDAASRVEWLNRIRYSGEPAWETRNHIMEAQWLPKNLERGVVREVTRSYGGARTRSATKGLSASTWAEKSGVELALPEGVQPRGTFSLDLIPADDVLKAVGNAPSGLILVVVRADRPKAVTRVSHMGFLIQTPKGPVLRHASKTFKKVADEPLAHYLSRNLDYGKWTVEGVALFEVVEPDSLKAR